MELVSIVLRISYLTSTSYRPITACMWTSAAAGTPAANLKTNAQIAFILHGTNTCRRSLNALSVGIAWNALNGFTTSTACWKCLNRLKIGIKMQSRIGRCG